MSATAMLNGVSLIVELALLGALHVKPEQSKFPSFSFILLLIMCSYSLTHVHVEMLHTKSSDNFRGALTLASSFF